MLKFAHDIAGGQGNLIAASFQSPNYVPGVSGWQVTIQGDAEFNNVTIRGQFLGTDFIINSAGAFFYSSTPAHGNLIASIAAAAGTDSFSNAYLIGICSYSGGLTIQLAEGTANFYPFSGLSFTPGEIFAGIGNLVLASPTEANTDSVSQALLLSKTAALASALTGVFTITDGVDGQVYDTQRLTLPLANATGTLTGLTTVLSSVVGVRMYRVHAQLYISATSGAQFNCELTMPAGATGQIAYIISRSTTFVGEVAGPPNSAIGAAVTLSTAVYTVMLDGLVTAASLGTMALKVGSLTATGLAVNAFSFLEIMPV